MPDRPVPLNVQGWFNHILERLRTVERITFTPLPKLVFRDTDCTEIEGTGTEQDPYMVAIRLDEAADNIITCGPDGLLATVDAVPSEFDAIVDDSFPADDEDLRHFTKISTALTYLLSIGLSRAFVLVRDGTYTETGNWTNPPNVFLIGTPGTSTGAGGPTWHHSGFAGSAAAWTIHNMDIRFGAKATGFVGALSGWFTAYNTMFSPSATTTAITTNPFCHYDSCAFDGIANLGGYVWIRDAEVFHVTTHGDRLLATNWIKGNFEVVAGSGVNRVWYLPENAILHISQDFQNRMGGSVSGLGITLKSLTGNTHVWRVTSNTPVGLDTTGAMNTSSECEFFGVFGNTSLSSMNKLLFDAQCKGTFTSVAPDSSEKPNVLRVIAQDAVDIAGPARVDIAMDQGAGNRTITLRNQINGNIISRGSTLSAGAFITGTNLDSSSISVTAPGGGASGTARPIVLDASSTQNVFVFHDRASWPNAILDNGTGNRFLPEGTVPGAPGDADYLVGTANATLTNEIVVGTTPGGELGNTWASPTIDTVHSGSAHSDFIAKAFLDAKGDLISATANDTPVIVGVGTDGDVLTADSGAAAGVSWQPAASPSSYPPKTIADGIQFTVPDNSQVLYATEISLEGSGEIVFEGDGEIILVEVAA